MEGEWFADHGREALRTWRTVLRPVAVTLAGRVEEIGADIARSALDEVDELSRHPDPIAGNVASSRDAVASALALLEAGQDPRGVDVPAATRDFVRECARSDVPLLAFLRELQVAHRRFTEHGLREIGASAADPRTLSEATELFNDFTFRVVQRVGDLITAIYDAERERMVRSIAAIRAETVRSIVDASDDERLDVERLSLRLGYRLDRPHLAVVLCDERRDRGGRVVDLEAIVARLADDLRADTPLVVPVDGRTVWAWIPGGTGVDLGAGSLSTQGTVGLAAGEPGEGPVGFRRSHREAVDTRALAERLGLDGRALRYREVELAALVLRDPPAARRFLLRHLGPLGRDEEPIDRLAETVLAYLEAGRSRTRAAKALHVHPNTVAYRLVRARELCGHDFEEESLELQVALRLRRALRR